MRLRSNELLTRVANLHVVEDSSLMRNQRGEGSHFSGDGPIRMLASVENEPKGRKLDSMLIVQNLETMTPAQMSLIQEIEKCTIIPRSQ